MKTQTKKITYFKEPGEQNTDALLKIVEEYVNKENINNIIVASSTGETGAKAAKTFKGKNTIVVTHFHGFQQPDKTELQENFKQEILSNGAKIFTGTHALSSAERAIRNAFGTLEPLELIANTLRLMGQGTKSMRGNHAYGCGRRANPRGSGCYRCGRHWKRRRHGTAH